jgi:hypothetical protein
MAWFRSMTCLSATFLLICLVAGCRSASTGRTTTFNKRSRSEPASLRAAAPVRQQLTRHSDDVIAVSHAETSPDADPAVQDLDDPFQDSMSLSLDMLIDQVQARNPSLAAMHAAWGAAAQKYPQAVALDDPMFQSMYAPESFSSSSNVQSSYYLGVAQKIPWAGKRGLRGQQADWEASAASLDIGETSLKLAEAARVAFLDY